MSRHIKNPVARSPLLRKGGAHVPSKSGQRGRMKCVMQQEIRDWKDEQLFISSTEMKLENNDDVSQDEQFLIKNKGNEYIALFYFSQNYCNSPLSILVFFTSDGLSRSIKLVGINGSA